MKFLLKLSKLNWIAAVITPASVILAEAFCLFVWLLFLGKLPENGVQRTPLSLASVLIIITVSFLVTKFFLKRKWREIWIQTCVVLCGLLTLFLVLRVEYAGGSALFTGQWFNTYGQVIIQFFSPNHPFLYAVIAGLLLWWRGIMLGRSRLYFDDLYSSFGIQLLLVVILIILWGTTFKNEALKSLTSQLGIYIAGFFFFGLLSLALSNLKVVQERIRKKGEATKNFGRKWFTIILSVLGGLFLISIGVASLFSEQTQTAIRQIMNRITDIYAWVVDIVIFLVGLIVQVAYYLWSLFVALISRKTLPPQPFVNGLPQPDQTRNNNSGLSPTLVLVIKLAILVLILGLLIFLIMKVVKRRGLADEDEDLNEEKESLWSWDGFKADLLLFLKNLFRYGRKKVVPAVKDESVYWKPAEDILRRLSIREIYKHLLWQGARVQIPREDYETPSEYARRLGQALPDIKAPLEQITGFYLDVRYGEKSAAEIQTDAANLFWQQLLNKFEPPERKAEE